MSKLSSVLSLCEKHGFLKKELLFKLKMEQFKVGPTGWLLLKNLKNEWFYNIVINKEISVFLSDNNSFRDTFMFGKNMCLEKLPFGVAEIVKNKPYKEEELIEHYKKRLEDKNVDLNQIFAKEDQEVLKCSVFTSSANAVQFFHQFQRQRRIWWRKFSPNPGRYFLTDIKTDDNNIMSVNIEAKLPWKTELVESIVMYPKAKDIGEEKFKDGKKLIQPHSIVSSINLTTMFMTTICDAYDESEYKGNSRTLLRFHRKLAPYRISFAVASSGVSASSLAELNDLALYLTKQLRSNHVSTLFLPSSSKLSLEAQWRQYDELGIPYNVLLNEKTLKDGLASLRSRDTTLKEQVHVTELVTYVDQLFRND